MIVKSNRRKLVIKLMASLLFVLVAVIGIPYGIMELEFELVGAGILALSFFPIFIRSCINMIKPSTIFVVENGYLISKRRKVELALVKGYYFMWMGLSNYICLVKKDGGEVKINLRNLVD
ncbi:hypothetical protein R4Z09_01130 [Niallia oryzisoli]|uniref:Photosystem I assembly protein Ycf4 n=1 Tax=Niallia oryzisoli TaxID=1737571 RepID=A0ABZ2CKR1_9BACI